jgi:hypothetical protein
MPQFSNLIVDVTPRQFWVWVDTSDIMANHNYSSVGSFTSPGHIRSNNALMFIPNPEFQGMVSPFQNNLMRNYIAEYNLELARRASFSQYPCRLEAIFLLESEADAATYQARNPKHVEGRILACGTTNGPYAFSKHDSAWITFLRRAIMIAQGDTNSCAHAYWSGQAVQDCQLQSHGLPWTHERTTEILFMGRLDFEKDQMPN